MLEQAQSVLRWTVLDGDQGCHPCLGVPEHVEEEIRRERRSARNPGFHVGQWSHAAELTTHDFPSKRGCPECLDTSQEVRRRRLL